MVLGLTSSLKRPNRNFTAKVRHDIPAGLPSRIDLSTFICQTFKHVATGRRSKRHAVRAM
jgi:hypothetical protein